MVPLCSPDIVPHAKKYTVKRMKTKIFANAVTSPHFFRLSY